MSRFRKPTVAHRGDEEVLKQAHKLLEEFSRKVLDDHRPRYKETYKDGWLDGKEMAKYYIKELYWLIGKTDLEIEGY